MLPAASLPANSLVLLLDDRASLARAEATLLLGGGDGGVLAVGIDAEWGPTEDEESEEDEGGRRGRGRGKAAAATLLQVALRLRGPAPSSPLPPPPAAAAATTLVLLFDLVALDHDAAAPLLKRLLSEDGSLPGALKLGWGLRGDLAALVAAGEKRRTALSPAARVARPAVDLRGAVLSLLQRDKKKNTDNSGSKGSRRRGGDFCCLHHGLGLAAAVASLLGVVLDKTHQRSSWGRRPLSKEQLEYAALDAAILLDLGEAVARRFLESENGEDGDNGEIGETEGPEPSRLYSFLKDQWARVITFDGSVCGVAGGGGGGGGGGGAGNGGSRRRRPRRQRATRKEGGEKAASVATEGEEEDEASLLPPPLNPPWRCPSEAKFLVDNNEGLARQLRLWGVDAASARNAAAADASTPSPSLSSSCGLHRGARAAKRAGALLASAVAEGRVLLTASRTLLLHLSSPSSPFPPSHVHLLLPSSSPSSPSSSRKGRNALPARELAASVLRDFGIRPGVGGGGGGNANGNSDGDGTGGGGGNSALAAPSPSSPALLSRCSACNGDFFPRPFLRDNLPAIALDALSRGSGKKNGGGRGDGRGADAAPHSQTTSLPFPEDKELWVCSNAQCGKVYWNGGMYERAIQRMTKRLERGLLD